MQEIFGLIIGISILLLGIPIGNLLARLTKEELLEGRRWFKLIVGISFIGVIISLIMRNDILFFSFLFIIVVTSRSLKKK